MDVVSGWNCPMVKNAVGTVAHLPHGADVLEMTIAGEVLHLAADLHGGGVFPVVAAGPFLEIEGERDHSQGREIISLPVHFPDLVAVPGQMTGNRTSGRVVYRKSHLDLKTVCTEHCFL